MIVCIFLASCGPKTEKTAAAPPPPSPPRIFVPQMDAPPRHSIVIRRALVSQTTERFGDLVTCKNKITSRIATLRNFSSSSTSDPTPTIYNVNAYLMDGGIVRYSCMSPQGNPGVLYSEIVEQPHGSGPTAPTKYIDMDSPAPDISGVLQSHKE